MTPLEDMLEREAIKELKARYFRHLDTKNWAEWRKVFTEDVVVRVDLTASKLNEEGIPASIPAGVETFVATMSARLADFVTVHHGHMPEITIVDENSAKGIWAMEDIVEIAGSDRVMRGYGHYHEDYRKVDGTWRIARMYLKRLRVGYIGGPAPTDAELVEMQKPYDAVP